MTSADVVNAFALLILVVPAGMSLWRKLFPKYACRKCRDTHVVESRYAIARCDCPGAMLALEKSLKGMYDWARKYANAQQESKDGEGKP